VTAATLTIDASALVKLIVQEPDSSAFRACILPKTGLVAPAHVLAETGEVLSRKLKAGYVDEIHIRHALDQLAARITVVELTGLLIPAIRLSVQLSISVYDCLYIATAQAAGNQLLTADLRLIERLRQTEYTGLLLPLDSSTGSP
jgi:predicted nucleic acid-binding protein